MTRPENTPSENKALDSDESENGASTVTARAPGRVNLIGEHTDYNDGFVLPMALPFETIVRLRPRVDRCIELVSAGFPSLSISLDDDPRTVADWGRYVAGMVRFLAENGVPCLGFDAKLETSIPVGASLSSSAALEVAIGFAVCGLAGIEPDPVKIARLGQRVENEIVGIQTGIMDQLISATAVAGSALRIDCRDLSSVAVRIPDNNSVMIMDTMTRRELVDSEYDLRRSSCERASMEIGVPALRDATLADLDKISDPIDRARARHVIAENARVLQAEDTLSNGDVAAFGQLMNESHESLRSDYAVSSEALDLISGLARNENGCFGARMTGGGFAGCAVAILESSRAATIEANVASAYEAATGVRPDLWIVRPAAGASIV